MVAADPPSKPFVVVELFTSEGCSSCPSADRLLSQIVDTEYENAEVMGLSFHVDYWDYIGWKDPYADSRFTERQRTYAQKLRSYQVYTPQMIVNGKHEFVGSNRAKWEAVLAEESASQSSQFLSVQNVAIEPETISVDILHSLPKHAIVNVAIVERDLSQKVTRGENRGRHLHHDNVVRSFTTVTAAKTQNPIVLELKDVKVEEASVIVYAQDARNYRVLAAAKRPLKP